MEVVRNARFQAIFYVWKVGLNGFPDGSDVERERKREFKDRSEIWGLSNSKDGAALS